MPLYTSPKFYLLKENDRPKEWTQGRCFSDRMKNFICIGKVSVQYQEQTSVRLFLKVAGITICCLQVVYTAIKI